MDDEEAFGFAAFQLLMAKAGPHLEAALSARGVSRPEQLSRSEASEILQNAIASAAVAHFPTVDVNKMLMGFRNFLHPRFFPALRTVQNWTLQNGGAFDPAVGPDPAIVLAGFGVPVVPLDKRSGRAIGQATSDLDAVAKTFDELKTALVGYPAHEVQFYVLATDCVRTLRAKVLDDPRFEEIRTLVRRAGGEIPPDTGVPFQHFSALIARLPGDRVSSAIFPDPHPARGSIILNAGWEEEGVAMGANNNGYLPVFRSTIIEIAKNPKLAFWLTEKANGEAIRPN